MRISKQCISSPDIVFDQDMRVTESEERFLANQNNKQRLKDFLSELLSENSIDAEKAAGDADRIIVRTALQKAEYSHTVSVGEDTDLVILLLFHLKPQHSPVFLENSRSGSNQAKFRDIQKVQDEIGSNMCQQLLFVHAISGCDTTSALYD